MPEEPKRPSHHPHIMRCVERFEHIIVVVLLAMMMLAILVSTIDLGWTLASEIIEPPSFLISVEEVSEIFGLVFMILIGLELLETIKTYLSKEQLHVEVVILVAVIAIARKVIILKIEKGDPVTLFGIAAIILALAGGFYLVELAFRKGRRFPKSRAQDPAEPPPPAET
jgi:uncharacterized membrane protein (DUF373 family)